MTPEHSLSALRDKLDGACAAIADVEVLESIDSTNRYLLESAADPAQRPRLVWALEQTLGRGRRGRRWVSNPQHSLTISIRFARVANVTDARSLIGLPIAVGISLVRTLSVHAPDLRLKWPNDLQRNGHKCVGILIESRRMDGVEIVVFGIGVNLLASQAQRAAAEQPICGLFDDASYPARETIVASVAAAMVECWHSFQRRGLEDFSTDWPQWDALAGREVNVLDGGRILQTGRPIGISATGALRLQTVDAGTVEIMYGDLSIRTTQAPDSPALLTRIRPD